MSFYCFHRSAKALAINKETVPLVATGNLSDYEIPEDLNSEYDEIISDLKEGECFWCSCSILSTVKQLADY